MVNSLIYNFESKYIYFQMANKNNPASWIVDVIATGTGSVSLRWDSVPSSWAITIADSVTGAIISMNDGSEYNYLPIGDENRQFVITATPINGISCVARVPVGHRLRCD